jgi:hypothetical protein
MRFTRRPAMTIIYAADGTSFPPKASMAGFRQPQAGLEQTADGHLVDLPAFHQEVCKPGEKMVCFACGGGATAPRGREPAGWWQLSTEVRSRRTRRESTAYPCNTMTPPRNIVRWCDPCRN